MNKSWQSAPKTLLICLSFVGSIAPGFQTALAQASGPPQPEVIASSKELWTGVAVSDDNRIFVNYPRWSPTLSASVAEIVDGEAVPYPNTELNAWSPEGEATEQFVSIQSVFVDDLDRLWILDTGNPGLQGVIPGGPKLLQVNLTTNTVTSVFRFAPNIAPVNSYLNDVRIDTKRGFAFLTDSGAEGAVIVLNLKNGEMRRVLANHKSVTSEGLVLFVGGQAFTYGGIAPRVNADGIAYDAGRDTVYFQALTSRNMYRIAGARLRDFTLSEDELATHVEHVATPGTTDGLISDAKGNIYTTAFEMNAILRVSPDGRVALVIQHPALVWPDSLSFGSDGALYVTSSRVHEGSSPQGPYTILRVSLPAQ